MIRNWYWSGRSGGAGTPRRWVPDSFVQLGGAAGRESGLERGFNGLSRGHFPPSANRFRGGRHSAGGQRGEGAASSIRVHSAELPARRWARRRPDPLRSTAQVRSSSH